VRSVLRDTQKCTSRLKLLSRSSLRHPGLADAVYEPLPLTQISRIVAWRQIPCGAGGTTGAQAAFQGKANTVGRLREQRQRSRVPGPILPAQCPFNVTPMEYKGYQIEVSRVGKGWRASIFSPDSKRPLLDSPSNLEKSKAEELVAEVKRIIDDRLNRQLS